MKKVKEVIFYTDISQNTPIEDWLDKLDLKTKSRIGLRLIRLEYGHYGDYKSLGNKLYELRIFFGKGYRVYFTEKDNKIIVLLCGGNKDSQEKDIKLAKSLLNELKTSR